MLGDSSAAGYGVDTVEETPGAILASGVAEAADRRVYLSSVARVGAQSKDLAGPDRPGAPRSSRTSR